MISQLFLVLALPGFGAGTQNLTGPGAGGVLFTVSVTIHPDVAMVLSHGKLPRERTQENLFLLLTLCLFQLPGTCSQACTSCLGQPACLSPAPNTLQPREVALDSGPGCFALSPFPLLLSVANTEVHFTALISQPHIPTLRGRQISSPHVFQVT